MNMQVNSTTLKSLPLNGTNKDSYHQFTTDHIIEAFVDNAKANNSNNSNNSKAELDAAVITLISSSSADIPRDKMIIIAKSVSDATIQIFMNTFDVIYLIDLLMRDAAKKLAVNHLRSMLTAGIAAVMTKQLQQNERDKGKNALATAITSAIAGLAMTVGSVILQGKGIQKNKQARQEGKAAEKIEKGDQNAIDLAPTPETKVLARNNSGSRSEVHRTLEAELKDKASQLDIIGRAVGQLMTVVTSVISAIGEDQKAATEALSIELRSFLDMIQKAYGMDEKHMEELLKELTRLGEQKAMLVERTADNMGKT